MNSLKAVSATLMSLVLLIGQTAPVMGNPAGGAVVAGSATIGGAGQTLTINQSTASAIINWQSFSIASGETTKFVVPNSLSATLNRVTEGNPSAIFGTLQSNGQVFLINPSGILVGAGGRIDTAGFLGSTLDVSNDAFMKGGDLHFLGGSNASVENQGSINAGSGDVYLIASQVTNKGTITAAQGDVGLAAGNDVLFQQAGDQHLFVQPTQAGTKRAVGVTNAGTVRAASAELKAAGGNAYALAINNTGSIAATGYKKINGQVFLTADSGTISNSGTISAVTATGQGGKIALASKSGAVTNSGKLNVSATVASGTGGTATLKTTSGQASNTGLITAQGGQGGTGGYVEVSGATVAISSGVVDTRAADGTTGMFFIDPTTFTVTPTVTDSSDQETGADVSNSLATSNVTLNADNLVLIADNITWTAHTTLTLSTNNANSTGIVIEAAINGVNGGLIISGATDTTGATATAPIDVSSFILEHGIWTQEASGSVTLPSFMASSDFEILNNSTFLRFAGGDGTTGDPYLISDIFGLQGMASPSHTPLTANYKLTTDLDASETATWNTGEGFVPIGYYDGNSNDADSFQGTFDGNNFTISGITIDRPSQLGVGFFGDTGNSSTVENLNLTNVNITGGTYVGGLVGIADATKTNDSSSGTVTGGTYVGGLLGIQYGTVTESFSAGTVIGTSSGSDVGGLVGYVQSGPISNSYSTAAVTAPTSFGVGGLVGVDGGSLSVTYATGAVSGGSSVGGLVGSTGDTIADSYFATDGTGQSSGVGSGSPIVTYLGTSVSNVTGLTIAQMKVQSNFDSNWDFVNTWSTQNGTTTPILLSSSGSQSGGTGGNGGGNGGGSGTTDTLTGTAFSDGGTTTVGMGITIDLISGGSVLGSTTTNNSGGFTFNVSSTSLTSGVLLTDVLSDATDNGNTFYQALNPASSITGIDIWGSTLRVVADTASNTILGQAIGGLSGHGINYSVSGASLSTTSGVNMNIVSNYGLDGNITAGGTFTAEAGSTITGSAGSTITAGSASFSGAMSRTGSLTVTTTSGDINFSNVGTSGAPATVHGLTLNAAGAVGVANSFLALGGGDFTATGHGHTVSGQITGINLFDTTIEAQGGNINLTGSGGYANVQGILEAGPGVNVRSDGTTAALLSTTGSGNVTITGTYAQNVLSQTAVSAINFAESANIVNINTVSVASGAITLNGTVSEGSSNSGIAAVLLNGGTQLTATGTGGSIAITGSSAGSTSFDPAGSGTADEGVQIGSGGGPATNLSVATNGSMSIHGTGGTVNSSQATSAANAGSANGVSISPVTNLTAGTGSTIAITGLGGAAVTTGSFTGSADGVDIGNSTGGITAIDVAQGGGLTINGTGGSIDTSGAPDTAGHDIPSAAGVAISADSQLEATGNGTLAVTGTGGTVHAGAGVIGSALGVSVGSDTNGDTTILSTDSGALTVTGTGGSTPSLGSGVLVHGTDGGHVNIESNSGNVALTGTGGTGYTGTGGITGDYIPNDGVGIVDNVTVQTTTGAISLTGNSTGHSQGVSILTLASNSVIDSAVTTPSIQAGGAFNATSDNGLILDGDITSATAPITLLETGGNLTLDSDAQLTDSGTGHDVTLVAGTQATPASYIINNSSAGANVIAVSNGARALLYSSDPTLDQLNGITATPSDTVFSATFPSSSNVPTGNSGLLFYVSGPDVVGYVPPGAPTTPPSTTIPPNDGNGSNVVPPGSVPQSSDVQPPSSVLATIFGGTPPPFSFNGTGATGTVGADGSGGLADSSGNAGSVGAGDGASLGGGELNNISNPAASGALNLALGPAVHNALLEALGQVADWSDNGSGDTTDDSTTDDHKHKHAAETDLDSGDVVEIGGSAGVKSIPLSQAPKPLQQALGNNVLGGMPGH
jgi:filamentous hemagglutinin family protein